MIKLRKLVTGAMDLKTCMQKYHGEAHDSGYVMTYLHVKTNNRNSNNGLMKLSTKEELEEAFG